MKSAMPFSFLLRLIDLVQCVYVFILFFLSVRDGLRLSHRDEGGRTKPFRERKQQEEEEKKQK